MMRSLFSGVSGLKAHQTMMDVTGDNIANINTAGFKGSRVVFADTLSQVMRSGNGASTQVGGTNTSQIGLGVKTSGIDMMTTQGSVQATGRSTDVAIQEEGYFVVRGGTEQLFTRAGSFGFDDAGNLADPSGAIVQGWLADEQGNMVVGGAPSDIKIPLGQTIAPRATENVRLGGNLNAKSVVGEVGSTVTTEEEIIDSLGGLTQVRIQYTKIDDNTWDVDAFDASVPVTDPPTPPVSLMNGGTPARISFSTTGAVVPGAVVGFTLPGKNGATATQVTGDLGVPGDAASLTQFGSSGTLSAIADGAPTGYMRSYAIGDDGTISGSFSNGEVKVLAQLAMASFTNPAGLVKAGGSHMRASASSGDTSIGLSGQQGRGKLSAGYLEGSNVDLAQEFTQLMIAQRGFQANSKIISTADEMLQELVNLKR